FTGGGVVLVLNRCGSTHDARDLRPEEGVAGLSADRLLNDGVVVADLRSLHLVGIRDGRRTHHRIALVERVNAADISRPCALIATCRGVLVLDGVLAPADDARDL